MKGYKDSKKVISTPGGMEEWVDLMQKLKTVHVEN